MTPMQEKKGGFRKIKSFEDKSVCNHPEHEPPMHIYLTSGIYEYECPSCGRIKKFVVPKITH